MTARTTALTSPATITPRRRERRSSLLARVCRAWLTQNGRYSDESARQLRAERGARALARSMVLAGAFRPEWGVTPLEAGAVIEGLTFESEPLTGELVMRAFAEHGVETCHPRCEHGWQGAGLLIYLNDRDPAGEGWAYRCASGSGPLGTYGEALEAVRIAALIAAR